MIGRRVRPNSKYTAKSVTILSGDSGLGVMDESVAFMTTGFLPLGNWDLSNSPIVSSSASADGVPSHIVKDLELHVWVTHRAADQYGVGIVHFEDCK